MKKLLLLLTIMLSATILQAYPPRVNMVDVEEVLSKTFVLDTNEVSDTLSTKFFVPFADSLSFIAEITYADSMNADGAKTTLNARIRYYTPDQIADTATFANLPVVLNLASGNALFGQVIGQTSPKKTGRAKLEYFLKNTNDGKQKITIKIYAIKEWSK